MQWCVDKEEEYIEGDILWINYIFTPVSFLNCRTLYNVKFFHDGIQYSFVIAHNAAREWTQLETYTLYKPCSTPPLYEPQPVGALQWTWHRGCLTGNPCAHNLFFCYVLETAGPAYKYLMAISAYGR